MPGGLCDCTTNHCEKNCADCASGDFIGDPEDCHRYYVCDGAGDLLFDDPLYCDHDYVFNIDTRKCEADAKCEPCQPECHYDCIYSTNGKVSYFYGCGSYFECDSSHIPGPAKSCPPYSPFFDGVECQSDERRCCHCHPYCYTGDAGKKVPDPKDCRNFYACAAEGIPVGLGHCPPGEYFENGDCSPHAICSTMCKNVVGLDGCIDPYSCVATGYFPKCPKQCVSQYYFCSQVSDAYVEAEECPEGFVFHPDTHVCVRKDDCPY